MNKIIVKMRRLFESIKYFRSRAIMQDIEERIMLAEAYFLQEAKRHIGESFVLGNLDWKIKEIKSLQSFGTRSKSFVELTLVLERDEPIDSVVKGGEN